MREFVLVERNTEGFLNSNDNNNNNNDNNKAIPISAYKVKSLCATDTNNDIQ